jgi:membrane protease YdiL (CAAX protease family)
VSGGIRLPEQNDRFPSGLEAVFLVVALFVAEYLVAVVFRDLRTFSGINTRNVDGVVALLGNGILFTWLLHYKRMSYASLFHPSRNSVSATLGTLSLPILLVIPGLALVMLTVVSMLVAVFPMSRWEQAMFERMMTNGFATVVSTCIVAPLLEEMLFRGIILRSFLNQYSRTRALLYSSLLFGLAHLNVYQLVIGFTLGMIAGWLYERTRSLWPCILLHASYNSLVTWLWLASADSQQYLWDVPMPFWGASVLLAFVGAALLRRLLGGRLSSRPG